MLRSGVILQKQGRMAEAREAFFRVARQFPDLPEAWLHLGVLEAVTGKTHDALSYFSKAVDLAPNNSQAHLNLGLARANLNLFEEAEYSFAQALRLNPLAFDAALNLGNIKLMTGHHQEALELFEGILEKNNSVPQAVLGQAAALCKLNRHSEAQSVLEPLRIQYPDNLDVRELTGMIYQGLNDLDNALKSFQFVLQKQPQRATSLVNLGMVLLTQGLYDKAEIVLNQAKAQDARNPDIWAYLGTVYTKLKQYEEAFRHFKEAISLNQNHFEAHINLGIALAKIKRFDEALDAYAHARAIQPKNPDSYKNEALVYGQIRQFDKAEGLFNRAIELAPDGAEIRFNRSMLRLSRNQFESGWQDYEHRFYNFESRRKFLETSKPRWRGEHSDKRLFIWNEQGVGDELLYLSFLKSVLTRVKHVSVRIDPRFMTLFTRSFPGVRFMPDSEAVADAAFDMQVPMGSLPSLFVNDLAGYAPIIGKVGYLKPNQERVDYFKHSMGAESLNIGLSWSTTGKHNEERNLPLAALTETLSESGRVALFNLQYLDSDQEVIALEGQSEITIKKIEPLDCYNDLDGLAAAISAMDIVVTCSNTTAHLAGALGKAVYVLVPYSRGKKWYWNNLIEGKCVWYPDLTVIDQTAPNDWSGPLLRLREVLSKRMSVKGSQ